MLPPSLTEVSARVHIRGGASYSTALLFFLKTLCDRSATAIMAVIRAIDLYRYRISTVGT